MNKILLLALILLSFHLKAQQLKAYVFNASSGEPLENVHVSNPASGEAVFSDANGFFTIGISQFPAELQFEKLGFQKKTVTLNSNRALKIYLQEDIAVLSEVVLRSSNIPRKIRETPAAISLISSEDLQKTDNFNLVQNLNFVPGVYVNQGGLNTNKINIRGIGSRSQYSTNKIKAYINGIPLTTAEGELTLDDFDPEFLNRIEVVKGPVSSLYGAGLGGSINMFTQTGRASNLKAEFSAGSFDTYKSRIAAGLTKNNISSFINLSHLKSDGFRQNDNYNRYNGSGILTATAENGDITSAFFSITDLKAYIPSSLNRDDFLNNPQKAAYTWYQAAGYESYKKYILGLSYSHDFTEKWTNLSSVFYNSRDGYEPRPFDILDENRNSAGLRTRFNYKDSFFKKPSELSFGAETMFEWYKTGTFENLYEEFEARESFQGDRLSLNKQFRNYLNLFAQMNIELSEKLLLETGINFNITSYRLNDEFADDGIDQSGNYSFDPVVSPRIGLSYEAFAGKNFYASVSHGFSTPTVAETLTPEGQINTDLKTETGINYEVGFKGNWLNNRLYTELNLYSIQISNLLVARRIGQDQYVGINAGKSDHNGIEFFGSFRSSFFSDFSLNPYLKGNFNFFKFDHFVDAGENYSGNTIPGVPEYSVTTGIDADYRQFSGTLNYQAFGEMALNDANSGYTDPYQLLNLKLNYNWQLTTDYLISFNFGINNLLDQHYAASIVPNAVGFGGSAPRYFYPGQPRNVFGGIKFSYNIN
ncbi:TonB-dependent receptor [Christiangramia fulva]|uniref:TonB-dependent receptor n=1 Tax=Christiangramia fulva TaxID=2126553 RepID=A0A2R3Z1A2_9FLAO|nr:TonB-dependent receptor [Christiangramia fulva]AVR44024.1 TonB-dependent receptor [Christiangramia fulva]